MEKGIFHITIPTSSSSFTTITGQFPFLQAEAAADLEAQLASVNDRYAALQKENEQNERSLEELDTQHQQVVGEVQAGVRVHRQAAQGAHHSGGTN